MSSNIEEVAATPAETELWETIGTPAETKTDVQFLESLSGWVIKHYGNVNVAQRLNILATSMKGEGKW